MDIKNKYYIILLLSLIFISCREAANENISVEESSDDLITLTKKQYEASKFELGELTMKMFPSVLNTSGNVHLPEKSQASVSTVIDGTVSAIDWTEGQWVQQGTKLFSITNPELINMQEEYLVIKEQRAYLKEEYNRQSLLASDNITTKKDLIKVKSELNTIEARYSASSKKLSIYGINTENLNVNNLTSSLAILAPISGYISEINILRGAYLESSTMALKIENTNQIYLELSVLEKDAAKLKKGEEITFSIQNNPTQKYNATIHLIQRKIDDNGMIVAQAHIDEETKKELLPGMYVNAQIEISNEELSALPEEAFVKLYDEWYVLQLESQNDESYKFSQVKVKVGTEYDGNRSVTGLSTESQYLTKGAYFLIQ